MRHQFTLPEEDVALLESLGLEWETLREPSAQWLLLHGFGFPPGYNHQSGSAAIQIPANYPVAALDMVYFFPHLARIDQQPLRQTEVRMAIDGKDWQRWSRHYPWVPGQHNLGTHIVLVRRWLDHGLGKN